MIIRWLCYFCCMLKLNFPAYPFRFKNSENNPLIFDEIRKKFVALTPEEWVRQHVLWMLLKEKGYPQSHINIEKLIHLHQTKKRYDLVVYNPDGSIHLIVECKGPSVPISQHTFDQIARYNLVLKASYLMVTNGMAHYFCKMDLENEKFVFLKDIPPYHRK